MLAKVLDNLTEVVNKECLELVELANKQEHESEFNNRYNKVRRLKLIIDDLELELTNEQQ